MTVYANGKIYTIKCKTDDNLVYVGSTIQSLEKRWFKHKYCCFNENRHEYNYIIYNTIRQNGGVENWNIELYENYPCNSKRELEKREGEIIRQFGTLNKRIEGRTHHQYITDNKEKKRENDRKYQQANKEEIKQKKQEYYEANKEELRQKNLEYCEANKEEIKKYKKEYREANKEEIKQKNKEYYEINKVKRKEYNKKQFTCECGSTITFNSKLRHFLTKKHQDYITVKD
jgi:hypothetical protein